MDLLLDIGNSRIKWAYALTGELSQHGSADRGDDIPEVAAGAWLKQQAPDRIIAANVAGNAYANRLDQWMASHWQRPVKYLQVKAGYGLELAYTTPQRFGVDRWLALLAARQLTAAAVAVIDAGTAMTMDVVTAQGRHQGGIITPGLRLMADALLQKSTGIQQGLQTRTTADGLLGNDTNSCIEQGAVFAVTGAIEHLLTRVEQQMATRLSVIISGGDAARLLIELERDCQHIPDLVLRGMQIINGD